MSLPASRNTTYAAGSEVKSADLNALQDWVVQLVGARRVLGPLRGVLSANSPTLGLDAWTYHSNSDAVAVPLDLRVGDTLTALTFNVTDDVDMKLVCKIWRNTPGGTAAQVGDTMTSAGTGAQAIALTGLTGGYVVAAGEFLYAVVTATSDGAGEAKLYSIELTP